MTASRRESDPHGVTIELVAEADKAVLANLVQLYRHDLSEFRSYELTEHGTCVYRFVDHTFLEEGRHALGTVFVLPAPGRSGAASQPELFGVRRADRSLVPLERLPRLASARFAGFPAQEVDRFYAETRVSDVFIPEPV